MSSKFPRTAEGWRKLRLLVAEWLILSVEAGDRRERGEPSYGLLRAADEVAGYRKETTR